MLTGPINCAKMSTRIKFPGCSDKESSQVCGTMEELLNDNTKVSAYTSKCYVKMEIRL